MTIYILSENITTLTRIILFKIGITNLIIQFALNSFVALFGSLIIYKLVARVAFLDFMFYPYKYISKKNKSERIS